MSDDANIIHISNTNNTPAPAGNIDFGGRLVKVLDTLPRLPTPEEAAPATQAHQAEAAALELKVTVNNFTGQPASSSKTTLRGVRSVADLDIIQRAMLAKCDPCSKWNDFELPTIVNAILYAEDLGLSFEQGDVYTTAKAGAQGFTKGNFSQTANARIKRAYAMVKFTAPPKFIYEDLPEDINYSIKTWKNETVAGKVKNTKLTVQLSIEGWTEPYQHETTLKEWFDPTNPNWRSKPLHMLRLNAYGHACEMINKEGATEDTDSGSPSE